MFWIWMLVWAVAGLFLGTQVNRFVYDWSYFCPQSPSPYSRRKRPYKTVLTDFFPVIGWLGISKRVTGFWPRFWIRPAFIELFCGICLPLLFWYYMSGGPIGGPVTGPFDSETPFGFNGKLEFLEGGSTTLWVWFFFHSAIFFLLLIATLIDFDERLIPDQITYPGLLLATATLTIWPAASMPTLQYNSIIVNGVESLHALSPLQQPEWVNQWWTIFIVFSSWLLWAILVSYWVPFFRKGLGTFWKILIASFLRPTRKSGTGNRAMPLVNKLTLGTFLISVFCTLVIYFFLPDRWPVFFSVSVSMTLAGAGGFAIRGLAGWALNQEAFGLGDVILMFMIGAAFGWQSILLIFVFSSILGLIFSIWSLIILKDAKLAFGPWICISTVIVVIAWPMVWTGFAEKAIFGIGPYLVIAIVSCCLLLLPVLLIIIQFVKRILGISTFETLDSIE